MRYIIRDSIEGITSIPRIFERVFVRKLDKVKVISNVGVHRICGSDSLHKSSMLVCPKTKNQLDGFKTHDLYFCLVSDTLIKSMASSLKNVSENVFLYKDNKYLLRETPGFCYHILFYPYLAVECHYTSTPLQIKKRTATKNKKKNADINLPKSNKNN